MFLGRDGFRFDEQTRKSLRGHLNGYDAPAIIADLEQAAEVFVVVRASPAADRGTFAGLTRLSAAAAALKRELDRHDVDTAAGDVLNEEFHRFGYDSTFCRRLTEGLSTLEDAVWMARRRRGSLKRGRRSELARDALVQDVAAILGRHRPTETRRKVLAALVKHGVARRDDTTDRLAGVVTVVLRAVKEPPQRDIGRKLRALGLTGKK